MEEHATRKRIYGNRFRGPGTELTAKTVHVMLLTLAEVFEFAKVTFLFAKVSQKLNIIVIIVYTL